MQRYPASLVTPFALAVPVSGLLSGWLLLGEELSAAGWMACVLVFVGLVITVLPKSALDRVFSGSSRLTPGP
ncbi:hypothetical protein D9M71_827980 [compost metagenome]